MPVVPYLRRTDWSFLGAVVNSGGSSLTLPALQDGDVGIVVSGGSANGVPTQEPIFVGELPTTPPTGWTLLAGYSVQSQSAPSGNGFRTPSQAWGTTSIRVLTAAMSGQVVSGGTFSGSNRLYLFRNSLGLMPTLEVFPEVRFAAYNQSVPFNNRLPQTIAGYATLAGTGAMGTIGGGAWDATQAFTAAYVHGLAHQFQRPAAARVVANAEAAIHRPFVVGF